MAWGDGNCSGSVNPVDSLLTLRADAGLGTNTGDCPDFGQVVDVQNASPHPWGDVDCSGDITPVDSLKVLRHDAGLSVQQDEPCPDIGTLAAIPGPTGPAGPQGPEGPPGITELELVISDSASDSDPKIWLTDCPEGKSVLGGGGRLRGNIDNVRITESNPIASLDAWIIAAAEFGAGQPSTWWIEVRAVCATVAE